MHGNGHHEQEEGASAAAAGTGRTQMRNLSAFLSAWCGAVGVHPAELAERAEGVKAAWAVRPGMTATHLKRFGSSRPHFYRLLNGQIKVDCRDREMLQYLSEIFEIDVVQLFDTVPDRVWPTVHLAPGDYVEAPLRDPAADGAPYLIPPEQLAGCPMHHLFIELDAGGTTGMHRHFAGTEMVRLEDGDSVTLRFPSRASNRREIVLHRAESVFFDATIPHQIANTSRQPARLFVSRNYRLEAVDSPDDAVGQSEA